ncbi:MAG: glycosyltransferase [Pirellulales bacterium]
MQDSLSILLPVYNTQSTLTAQVMRILEVAGELTDQLQVVIIDNGSLDHTLEVAYDLSIRFPQVDVIRSNKRYGARLAIEVHQQRIVGDVVMLHRELDAESVVQLAGMMRLWNARWNREGRQAETIRRQGSWLALSKTAIGTTQFRADPLELDRSPGRPNFLTRIRDFALGE